jgi:hypothetical protein
VKDYPAHDRVVLHLLEGCLEAGREGKRAKQCNSHEGGWMDGWMIEKVLIATVDAMIGVTQYECCN